MKTKDIWGWYLEKCSDDGMQGFVSGMKSDGSGSFHSKPLKDVRLDDGILVMTDGISEIRCEPNEVLPGEFSEADFRNFFSGIESDRIDGILDAIRDTIAEIDEKYWSNIRYFDPFVPVD